MAVVIGAIIKFVGNSDFTPYTDSRIIGALGLATFGD